MLKKAMVYGAGGFIGNHMVNRLKDEGYWVCGVDIKFPEFQKKSNADEFTRMDLRVAENHWKLEVDSYDEIYQFAADMGGASYVFSGAYDAIIMNNSAMINLNLLTEVCRLLSRPKVFFSSSACIYPEHNQLDPDNPNCEESSAYPANPDSEYGWEKLFSERLYKAFERNYSIPVRIARYHNIYGPLGTWRGGKEKAPAAICRKVASTPLDHSIEIWGDGKQTRSFLYIDDCIEATRRLMKLEGENIPIVNIGSEEMVSINTLCDIVMEEAGKKFLVKHIDGPLGVRGRCSHNKLVNTLLDWEPQVSLRKGIKETYQWILEQIVKSNKT